MFLLAAASIMWTYRWFLFQMVHWLVDGLWLAILGVVDAAMLFSSP